MNEDAKLAIQILREAMELITPLKRWTTETYARDDRGECVLDVDSESATCFCAQGALGKVKRNHVSPSSHIVYRTALDALWEACQRHVEADPAYNDGYDPIVYTNDVLGHECILQAFDQAILSLKEKSDV